MIRPLMTIFSLIICLNCFSQRKDTTFIINKPLEFHIQADFNTTGLRDPFLITIKIKNISKEDLVLPLETNFSSNLFPNGLVREVTGFNIHFDILPLKDFSSIFIEDLVFHKCKDFKKISPNEIIEIKYDFGKHISIINSQADNNPRIIEPNRTYSITATLTNSIIDESSKESFVGKIRSNKIQIYLKE